MQRKLWDREFQIWTIPVKKLRWKHSVRQSDGIIKNTESLQLRVTSLLSEENLTKSWTLK